MTTPVQCEAHEPHAPNYDEYLSGPMRGLPDFNYPLFTRRAQELRSQGKLVFNPAESFGGRTDLPIETYMNMDLHIIKHHAKAIRLLPGWQNSEGAQQELRVALEAGLAVIVDEAPVAAAGEVRVTDPKTGAQKCQKAARFDLLPPRPLWQIAEHYGKGSIKYTRRTSVSLAEALSLIEATCSCEYAKKERDSACANDATNDLDCWDTVQHALKQHCATCAVHLRLQFSQESEKNDNAPLRVTISGDRNWELGYRWSLSYGAMMRHLNQFWQGEDFDAETGSPHLAAVGFHVLALLEFARTHPEMDDRPYHPHRKEEIAATLSA